MPTGSLSAQFLRNALSPPFRTSCRPYNSARKKTADIDPLGNQTTYTCARGIPIAKPTASGTATFTFDVANRITTMLQGAALTTYTNDANGNMTVETPPERERPMFTITRTAAVFPDPAGPRIT